MDPPDVAWIIFAAGAFVVCAGGFVLIWRSDFRSGHVDLGPVKVGIEALHDETVKVRKTAEAINAAVNNVAPGTPPLPERIGELEAMQRWIVMAVRIIGAHTGAVIPDPPQRRNTS